MTRRYKLLLAIACLANISAFACRAVSGWHSFIQPDGKFLTLMLCGDEHYFFYRDPAGTLYKQDRADSFCVMTEQESAREAKSAAARRSSLWQKSALSQWDAGKTYRQLVVLVSFRDLNFSMDDPQAYYQRLFNEHGYNERHGAGGVADYFRDQSKGMFNVQFDVCGPVKVSANARSGNGTSTNYGRSVFSEALNRLSAIQPSADYSSYDWDGDGTLEQVVIVYAGYAGNQPGLTSYIWPNTGTLSTVTLSDGHLAERYSASGEQWSNKALCGIGTICHEYSHCLGLPDIYPTSSSVSYPSVVDEWDIMDDGNVSDLGWCPPNYSPLEKILLGWTEPVELNDDASISGLESASDGGTVYQVRHTDNEYYLIENRQWQGWDMALPGKGLLVWHVNYNPIYWMNNMVNNEDGKPNYHLVSADNLTYTDWVRLYNSRGGGNPYADKAAKLHKCIMSTASYPWQTDSTSFVNDCLTDSSLPASIMYNTNAKGLCFLSKPITNISQNDDGTVSFTFHTSNDPSAITNRVSSPFDNIIFDLYGNRIISTSKLHRGIYIINGKKRIIF